MVTVQCDEKKNVCFPERESAQEAISVDPSGAKKSHLQNKFSVDNKGEADRKADEVPKLSKSQKKRLKRKLKKQRSVMGSLELHCGAVSSKNLTEDIVTEKNVDQGMARPEATSKGHEDGVDVTDGIDVASLSKSQKKKLKKKLKLKEMAASTSKQYSSGSISTEESMKKNSDGGKVAKVSKNGLMDANDDKKKPLKRKLSFGNEEPLEPVVPSSVTVQNSVDSEKSPSKSKKKKKKPRAQVEMESNVERDDAEVFEGESMTSPKKKKKLADPESSNAGSGIEQSASVGQSSKKITEILEELKDVVDHIEARKLINECVENGRIEEGEVVTIMQKWRQQKRKRAHEERKEKVVEMEGTLGDVKRVVTEMVRKGKLREWEAGDIIKRWKKREKRRVGRQIAKQTDKVCLRCREKGHVLADCPEHDEDEQSVGNVAGAHGSGICFKCGSTEHRVQKCPRKHVKGFPFATCFVCEQQGHLSKDCEQNTRGIYPDGGSCNVCGSTKHLKRECPELAAQKQKKDEKKVKVRAMTAMSSADAEDFDDHEDNELKAKPKKKKIVKF